MFSSTACSDLRTTLRILNPGQVNGRRGRLRRGGTPMRSIARTLALVLLALIAFAPLAQAQGAFPTRPREIHCGRSPRRHQRRRAGADCRRQAAGQVGPAVIIEQKTGAGRQHRRRRREPRRSRRYTLLLAPPGRSRSTRRLQEAHYQPERSFRSRSSARCPTCSSCARNCRSIRSRS